ncbi:MAG: hypothetical protein H3Z53_12760 [archaeon]|nr:hypothetical protein [archaeon]
MSENRQVPTTEVRGYIIGLVVGDGWLSDSINLELVSSHIVDNLLTCLAALGIRAAVNMRKPSPGSFGKRERYVIRFKHDQLLRTCQDWKVIVKTTTEDRDFAIGFLSGFIDAEGTVYSGRRIDGFKRFDLQIVNTDRSKIKLCQYVLRKLGVFAAIKSSERKDRRELFLLRIHGRRRIQRLVALMPLCTKLRAASI